MFTKRLFISIRHRAQEYFKRIPIKFKVIILLMGVCVVSVSLTTIAYIASGVMYIEQNQKAEISVLADILGDKNAAALAFRESGIVRANMEMLSGRKSIMIACVYDDKGHVFANYIPAEKEGITCPEVGEKHISMVGDTIEIFHIISKNDTILGNVFIKSDLTMVDVYIKKAMMVAAITIIIVLIFSFLLALKLQNTISKPITDLAKEAKAIFTEEGLGGRTRKVYYDELGEIADSFNKILEEREEKHRHFFEKDREISEVFKSSEKTLAILDDEAIFPFKAASTFKQMLEMKAFGPVHESYVSYFNDVYTAEVELYHVLLTALDTFKLQSEIFQIGRESVDITKMLDQVLETHLEKKMTRHIHFSLHTKSCVFYTAYRKPLERMIITLVSLFVESKEMGYLYNCVFHVEKENQGRNEVMIITEFYRQNTNAHYSNDNYNEISLESLIRHLKHNEPVSVEMEGLCIDFEDMTIRNMLYSIHFLSDINCCDIRIKLSAHKMTFLLRFNSNALQERLPDDEGGEVLR